MAKMKKLEPLVIKCTDTDCENGKHCFKQLKSMSADERGTCRECGIALVDWPRVHERSFDDAANTFEALKHELIRHHFFHAEIDQRALNHATRKGRDVLYDDIENRVRKSIGAAEPARDGRQTPMNGNTLYYAQHATATCCRTCLSYWHAIPIGRELTDQEVTYCGYLMRLYLDLRLPELLDEGVKVPSIRRPKRTQGEHA